MAKNTEYAEYNKTAKNTEYEEYNKTECSLLKCLGCAQRKIHGLNYFYIYIYKYTYINIHIYIYEVFFLS